MITNNAPRLLAFSRKELVKWYADQYDFYVRGLYSYDEISKISRVGFNVLKILAAKEGGYRDSLHI